MDCRRFERFFCLAIAMAIVVAVGSGLPVTVAAGPHWNTESWRSAPVSEKATDLVEPRTDSAHVMPMYEVAMASRLCADRAYRKEARMSRDQCLHRAYRAKRECTSRYQRRFPRGDDAEVDGRLTHRKFAAAYMACLRSAESPGGESWSGIRKRRVGNRGFGSARSPEPRR